MSIRKCEINAIEVGDHVIRTITVELWSLEQLKWRKNIYYRRQQMHWWDVILYPVGSNLIKGNKCKILVIQYNNFWLKHSQKECAVICNVRGEIITLTKHTLEIISNTWMKRK